MSDARAAALARALERVRAGEVVHVGGVDYRGGEEVGGSDSIFWRDGSFHCVVEEFHGWHGHRDYTRQDAQVFDEGDALIAWLGANRPFMIDALIQRLGAEPQE